MPHVVRLVREARSALGGPDLPDFPSPSLSVLTWGTGVSSDTARTGQG